jgi:Domain of unknown function (DUF222)
MAGSAIRESIGVASVDRSGWSAAARSAELVGLLEERERLEAQIIRLTGEWDRDQCWAADDALAPVSRLLHRVPLTRPDAMVLVRTARHVVAHEQTAKAPDVGDISATRTTIIARAVRHREELYPEHEDLILDAARALTPTPFRDAMQHWRACADAVLDHRDTREQLDGNYLDLATTFGGVGHVEGRLDPISLAASKKVLDELEPPDPKDALIRRNLSQRRADALMRLVTGDRPPEVHIDGVVDLDTGRAHGDRPHEGDLRARRCRHHLSRAHEPAPLRLRDPPRAHARQVRSPRPRPPNPPHHTIATPRAPSS